MAQKSGSTQTLIMGIGGLVITTILVLAVVSIIWEADLLGSDTQTNVKVANETGSCNSSGYAVARINASTTLFVSGSWMNDTAALPLANCTISSAGVVKNATPTQYNEAKVSYSFTMLTNNEYERPVINMREDFGEGVFSISAKVTTILLIAAVILLFGVLILLITKARQMTIGSSSSL